MYPQIKITHNIGNTLEIPNQMDVIAETYLSDNVNLGVDSVPVDNAMDFPSSQGLLLLSSVGSENAEIVKVSSKTDKSFNVGSTKMAHNRGI